MTTSLVATHDPPPKGIANPIHDDEGATSSGYAGALVAGVRTYGWTVGEMVGTAGEGWLDDGWADFTLHRPVFVGDDLVIEATDGELAVRSPRGDALTGTFGTGVAPFFGDIDPPSPTPAQDPPEVRPTYTLSTAPVGEPLRSLGVYVTSAAARRLATDDLGIDGDPWANRVHPYFLAARMAPLTRHNFTYGPTIHFRTQIQHLGVAASDQQLTISARIVEVYERNDHWYQILDGVITAGTDKNEVARLRHHTIFRPRPAPSS